MKQEWNKSEQPYIGIKASIKAKLKSESPQGLYKQLKKKSEDFPASAEAQFARGYALIQNSLTPVATYQEYEEVYRRMLRVDSPNSYEFARVQFLVGTPVSPAPGISILGERLLQRNPKDYQVMFYLIDALDMRKLKERQLAIQSNKKLIAWKPQNSTFHSSMGSVYFRIFLITHARTDGDLAIAAYNRFLQLAKPQDDFRAAAQSYIKFIQKEQNDYAKQKSSQ